MEVIRRLLAFIDRGYCTELDFKCMYPSIIFKGIKNIEPEFFEQYINKNDLYRKTHLYNKNNRIKACNDDYCCRRLHEEYAKNFPVAITSTQELTEFARNFTAKLRCELLLHMSQQFPDLKLYDDFLGIADQICFNDQSMSNNRIDAVETVVQDYLKENYKDMFVLRRKTDTKTFKERQKSVDFKEKSVKNLKNLILYFSAKCKS